jgi:dethiobiotin synthetase
MKTILLVPTGEGVGLTSACLGLVYALECQGVKAGFLKPFSQELTQVQTVPQRSITMFQKMKPLNRLVITPFCNNSVQVKMMSCLKMRFVCTVLLRVSMT